MVLPSISLSGVIINFTISLEHLPKPYSLWENLAAQDSDFGHPDVFCEDIPERSWFVSATTTMKTKIRS